MRRYPLRTLDHPDLSNHVVHFTGRTGLSSPTVPHEIRSLTPEERLAQIVLTGQIRGFPPFGIDDSVVCFTDATEQGIAYLMKEHRYLPWGVAFRKETAFEKGAGPAFYVRGDEWDAVAELPSELRARATRFWPGAEPDVGENLPGYLGRPSEFLHEREWRVRADRPFEFTTEEIAYIIVGDRGFLEALSFLATQEAELEWEYARASGLENT
jgi:hypothetical protein